MIAFFGMGLLGANFVRAALRRGERVQVWNRTPDKARALEAEGARAFSDPADAARGASRIHLALSDDAAVESVLQAARAGIAAGAIIVDHTTTSATGAAERHERFASGAPAFAHAPVFMGPQNALEASGTMLLSGPAHNHERLRPELEKMTGKLVYLGADPQRAAQFKLLGNLFLMFITTGVGETLALAKSFGIAPDEAAQLFQFFNPGLSVPARVARILASPQAAPSWQLQMARKDARLMLEAAAAADQPLNVLASIAATMDQFIERGHAQDDWTVIASAPLAK